MGRLLALSIVAACCVLQTLSALPTLSVLSVSFMTLSMFLMSCRWVRHAPRLKHIPRAKIWINTCCRVLVILIVFVAALAWATLRAEWRLADKLAPELENVVSRITFQVTGLVQDQGDSLKFEAQVLADEKTGHYMPGIPRFIQVVWKKPSVKPSINPSIEIRPGQHWRAAMIFRRPRTALNPHGFDFESHLLSRNIRAVGRVRGNPVMLAEHPFSSLQVVVSGARQVLRKEMRHHVGEMTFGAVLIALAIGDQDSVSAAHWDIFNKTGITHLVSISGSHVTMLAAFGGVSMLWLWKRLRWRGRALGERVPAKVVAGIAALCVAWLYCLLAGWGVPARRTFFMLLVSGSAIVLRLPISPSRVLCLAAAVVCVIDPWSPVATGFWLSFGAVAVLFYVGSQMQRDTDAAPVWWMRLWHILKESARLQWVITLAMLPPLAFLFQQVSLSSPFANAVAIPVVTFIVTPLALIAALLSLVPGVFWLASFSAWLAHLAMDWCMVPVTWLAYTPWSSLSVSAMPAWCLVLSLIGIAWALQPPGVPVRWVGWSLLLPALTWQPKTPALGDWHMIALDVGQGGSVFVRTKHHALLFDAGPRVGATDAGARVIAPVLRALGVKRLDALVVSHPDSDHAGGVPGLLREIPIVKSLASFELSSWLDRAERVLNISQPIIRPREMLACEAGQQWHWDGVAFSILHPEQSPHSNTKKKIKTNAHSCVLHIQGQHHSVLLPGDIGVKEEEQIVLRAVSTELGLGSIDHAGKNALLFEGGLRADLIVVAHHGSSTSSSPKLVTQLRARHAVAQMAYLNRFSHPAPEVQARWVAAHANFWRTDRHGAVTAQSSEKGLNVYAEASHRKRYWHERE